MAFYEQDSHPAFKERYQEENDRWEARKDYPWHVAKELPSNDRWVIVRYIGIDCFPHIGYSRTKTEPSNGDWKSSKDTWTTTWEWGRSKEVTHWMECPPIPHTRENIYCSCLSEREGSMLRTRIPIPQYNFNHWHEKTQVTCHKCGKVFELFRGVITPHDL